MSFVYPSPILSWLISIAPATNGILNVVLLDYLILRMVREYTLMMKNMYTYIYYIQGFPK